MSGYLNAWVSFNRLILLSLGMLFLIAPEADAFPIHDPAAVAVTAERINDALRIPLLDKGNFWQEKDADVARRLGLPSESLTTYESGYRTYELGSVLGVKAYSIFLQGKKDHPSSLSVLFANKGDVSSFATGNLASDHVSPQMIHAYEAAIRHDQDELREKLDSLFGESKPATIGINSLMQERGDRWDWNGITFFLAAPRNEYIVLRVLHPEVFDVTNAARDAFQKSRDLLSERVTRRPNGDVVITDIPMVDQGPKGYCVPATFERILRYYGLQADMNLLASGGHTSAGGGTSLSAICNAAYLVVGDAGGRVIRGSLGVRIKDVSPYIDKGQPVIWALFSSGEFNQRANERMEARKGVSDWSAWNQEILQPARKASLQLPKEVDPHVCLIIGYNLQTGEVAISDSWGAAYQERWMTQEEVIAVSQGETSVIGW